MPKKEILYLAMEDFPNAIDATIENGWVVIWLPTMRVKFRPWKSS